tara:strand:- start:103 stop:903 length:801 start_codon:yes stop_codon:yes gene_type:complete
MVSEAEVSLDLIVENEDESTTGSSEDVGKASLEESFTSLIFVDLLEAVHGSVVHLVGSGFTGSHHESSSDGIKWIRDDTSGDGDALSETPLHEEMRLSVIFEQDNFTGIEHTEIRGSVSDDTNDGDTETVVELTDSVLGHLGEAIDKSSEFSLSSGTDISGESGSGEIEWINEAEGSGTSGSTGSAVTDEEHTWLFLWVIWVEGLLVEIFASEVQSLGWEITDDVSKISSPEGTETLFSDNSLEAISDTVESIFNSDVFVGILNLE